MASRKFWFITVFAAVGFLSYALWYGLQRYDFPEVKVAPYHPVIEESLKYDLVNASALDGKPSGYCTILIDRVNKYERTYGIYEYWGTLSSYIQSMLRDYDGVLCGDGLVWKGQSVQKFVVQPENSSDWLLHKGAYGLDRDVTGAMFVDYENSSSGIQFVIQDPAVYTIGFMRIQMIVDLPLQ